MSEKRKHIQHYHSQTKGAKPTPESLFLGELSVNTADETIMFKNNNDEIVEIKPVDTLIEISYSNLVNLRDNGQLIPGVQYRITDYVTTTSQENTQSANHPFDVIVLATSANTLSENARAAIHDGDTYFTENGANLDAWEIKYVLDNDTERFYWADATNGKGVIYYMKDEWNNECPYDFKNIMFLRDITVNADTGMSTIAPKSDITQEVYCYTFNYRQTDGVMLDTSIYANNGTVTMLGNVSDVSFNKINALDTFGLSGLPGINSDLINFSIKQYFLNHIVFFAGGSSRFYGPIIDNIFGAWCQNMTFGNFCSSNSFGEGCVGNSFRDNCYNNTFGNGCINNTFGNSCFSNTFGIDCSNNTFGGDCYNNSFGNNCESNSFGYFCYSNSFGHNCSRNSFRVSADTASALKDFVRYNHFDDGCSYNVIWNSDTTSSSVPLKNINVNRGVCGTNSSYNFINVNSLNSEQEINVNQVDGIISIGDILSIKYESLKTLRNNAQLIPGQQYRIIDYVTTTNQAGTQSAGYQFDIIVTADDESTLNEVARAIQHDGDTYFADSDLNAWQIWYCLDNDTTKFGWADATNGKGVIYRMIDEFNNECPYDFKNIKFKRFELNTPVTSTSSSWLKQLSTNITNQFSGNSLSYIWAGTQWDSNNGKHEWEFTASEVYSDLTDNNNFFFTFSYIVSIDTNDIRDLSITGDYCNNNVIKEYYDSTLKLNDIVFFNTSVDSYCQYNIFGSNCYFNSFGNACRHNSFGNSCNFNSFGDNCGHNNFGDSYYYNTLGNFCRFNNFSNDCSSNSFGNSCNKNSFGNICFANSLGDGCYYNSFGNGCFQNNFAGECTNNSFDNECYSNSFGNKCNQNTFSSKCYQNSFGNGCYSNSFGNGCYKNNLGSSCYKNNFGNGCYSNTFRGSGCYSNILGNGCYSNYFEGGCYGNSFGNECVGNYLYVQCYFNSFSNNCGNNILKSRCNFNSFGNGCSQNNFLDLCTNNSFGNECHSNSFGGVCCHNSFGNDCKFNSFRNVDSPSGPLSPYCYYNHFDDGCSYNVIWNSDTKSSSVPLKNINVNRGVCGTSSSYNIINIQSLNSEKEININNYNGHIYIDYGDIFKVTYSELVTLRDNSQLIPGRQYRIIDYVTTTSQANTQSAGHQFDVIVTATDESTLSENALAAIHDGDTYFADSDLNAWQIWYCLDNDTDKFAWTDATNGKGVIYRMIDEFGNDCPYDFKNIQFKHPTDTTTYPGYYYTFSTVIDGVVTDHSMSQDFCYGNTMKEYINSKKQSLNYNVFLNTSKISNCSYNSFGKNGDFNSFGDGCYNNSFGNDCYSNSFGDGCYNNSFGNDCSSNSFGDFCEFNSFRSGCSDNFLGDFCSSNSFGDFCYYNTFGNSCFSNTFGIDCSNNTFGDGCYNNSFGNNCESNSFGYFCYSNSFGHNCSRNSFRVSADTASALKDYVEYNHFDDGCFQNVIWNSDTTSTTIKLKNVNVNRGVVGIGGYYTYINIDILNQGYEIQVAKNSNGEIKIYCEADLIL